MSSAITYIHYYAINLRGLEVRKTSVLRRQCKILDFTPKNANILYEKHARI